MVETEYCPPIRRLRYEARQNLLHEQFRVKVLGISTQEVTHQAPLLAHTAASPPSVNVPSLKLPTRRDDKALNSARGSLSAQRPTSARAKKPGPQSRGRRATEKVVKVMQEVFDCVFEPFVVMDADGDEHVTRADLKRMMARMGIVDVSVDEVCRI